MRHLTAAIIAITFLAAVPVSAQPIWLGDGEDHALTIEWHKPIFDDDDRVGFMMSTIILGYRSRTSENLTIVLDLPMSNYEYEGHTGQFLLGNPYVGLAFGNKNSELYGDVGVRLPITDDDPEKMNAVLIGTITEIDRLEMFLPNTVPVSGLLRYRTYSENSNMGLRAHFGPSILVFTDDRGSDDMEVFLKYGLLGEYRATSVRVQLGFTGIFNTTNDRGDFSDNSEHQLGFAVNFDAGGRVWPGVMLQLPLSEDRSEIISMVLGLNAMIML
ncbi:MAG: hypothetical protein C0600_00760 [Ignavibacteria bacterium]|nr:MAG: hypothetical protein C0600_00760 [Ignavibacteria bacterium]